LGHLNFCNYCSWRTIFQSRSIKYRSV